MKKRIVVILLLISSSIFANDKALIEEIQNVKVELRIEAEPIGREAYIKFGFDNNASIVYIKKECQRIILNFDYLESKGIVKNLLFPNCLEFAIEAMSKE
jgi:predicted choloylglycine hydrolase